MCGIAGLFSPAADSPRLFDSSTVTAMTDAIEHRGPDEAGLHREPHVALGHRRLSIIDVATGQQPLFNEDGTVAVVYNGEIYNYLELVAELEAAGHRFHTRSDTEVIVHAWEQWGADCVKRFRGMFAFAVWDRQRRTLFLGRDRLGVKPLYYAVLADGTLAFGSELKCLTLLPGFRRELDDKAVEDYFALGYVPDPDTIYRGARKLSPAHWLTWKVGDREPTIRSYWDVTFDPDESLSVDEACAQLRERVTEAVRIRLMSEVPLGAFLSGGVDSSAVVATMARLSADPVKTCSIGFDVPDFDESEYAAAVARQYRTDHVSQVVDAGDLGAAAEISAMYDEPFADSSALPTYRVCALARQRVTVALSGDGGDETFGGYRRYRLHLMEERFRSRIPLALRRMVFGPLGAIYPKLDFLPRPLRAKTTFQSLARDSADAYFHSMSVLRHDDRFSLYQPRFRQALGQYDARELFREHAQRATGDDPLSLIQYLDYHTYLPGDINTKVDRASMKVSLETREPLMDHQLIEWAARLPRRLKASPTESKIALKKAFEPLLSHDILYRQKMGFAVPLADWFRAGSLTMVDLVPTPGTPAHDLYATYIDQRQVATLLAQHQKGQRDWSAGLWSLRVFSDFVRREAGQ